MKRFLWTMLIALALALAGCSTAQPSTPTPVAAVTASAPANSNQVVASAIVVPVNKSDLSFVISGTTKELSVKEGDAVQAGQTLMILNSPDLEFGLAQAEAAFRAATADYQYWIPPRLNRPPERRELAKAQLVIAQTALETARANLAQSTLLAPFDGTVISINTKPGELVQPTQVVMTIANLDSLQIETTDLSERDIPKVKIGQSVQVNIKPLDSNFTGTITAISPISSKVGGDVVYKVTITLNDQPAGLLWGMSAEVVISTEQ
jgi:multidrug efflux pump subunit AcrA (membrane-fusion protein)